MQFFSRYSYIWKFPDEQEKAYSVFVLPANRAYLRLVSFITIFGMSLFLIIDSFKSFDFSVILMARSAALLAASFTMVISFKKELSVRMHFACIALLMIINFGVAITTALFTSIPPYYLTNLLFLIFVLTVTASGLSFRHAVFLNLACMSVFLAFSQVIKRDPFYFSQYPHLFSIFIYILIVGIVLENRRRLSFLNFTELEEQKKLVENLNQQKNKIISILSHDIAAPLNSLSGLVNLQTRGMVKEDQIGPYVSQLGDRIESVHGLLQSLMRWSKSQIDGFVPDKKTIDVAEVITGTCQQFASQVHEKSLQIRVTGMPAYAMADMDMMTLVFRNLISNAVKFSKLNGIVEVNILQREKNLVIKFSNTGESLSDEQKQKLFTYEMKSTTGTAGEKGTGLGLAMSAYFVQLNNGKIYMEDSVPGQTVFCVELPAGDVKESVNA